MSQASSIEDLMANLDQSSRDKLMAAYEKDKTEREKLVKAMPQEKPGVLIGGTGFPGNVAGSVP